MSLVLYAHPFSSYCQKVLVALYENGTLFDYRRASKMRRTAPSWPRCGR